MNFIQISVKKSEQGIAWNFRLSSRCDLKYFHVINLNIKGKEERSIRKQKHREKMMPRRYLYFQVEKNQTGLMEIHKVYQILPLVLHKEGFLTVRSTQRMGTSTWGIIL